VFRAARVARCREQKALGIGAEYLPWPPPHDRARPYRGWAPLEEADAAVFFGRDAPIPRAVGIQPSPPISQHQATRP
jgi:hypothetical protein